MLEDTNMRNDIKIGEVAMRLAVDSYGRDGADSAEDVVRRSKVLYAWLMTERKR